MLMKQKSSGLSFAVENRRLPMRTNSLACNKPRSIAFVRETKAGLLTYMQGGR